MSFKLSRYIFTTNPISGNSNEGNFRLLFSTRTGKVIRVSEPLLAIMNESDFESLPESIVNHLMDLEIIVPEEEDELKYILGRNRAITRDKGCLSLVVDSRHLEEPKEGKEAIRQLLLSKVLKLKIRQVFIVWLMPEGFSGYDRLAGITAEYREILKEKNIAVAVHAVIAAGHMGYLLDHPAALEGVGKVDLIISDMELFLSAPGAEDKLGLFFDRCRELAGKCQFRIKLYCDPGVAGKFRDWVPLLKKGSDPVRMEVLILPKLREELYESRDLVDLMKYINASTRFPLYMLPEVSIKHLRDAGGGRGDHGPGRYVLETDELADKQDYSLDAFPGSRYKRSFPGRGFESQLERGSIPCSGCCLLPFCGGYDKKLWAKKEARCPPYKEHFTELLKIISKVN